MAKKTKYISNKKINSVIIILYCIFSFAIFAAVGVTFTLFTTNSDGTITSNDNLSGVFDNQVIVDNQEADWYYYQGLNYVESSAGTLPTGNNQKLYDYTNLVKVKIIYSGIDIEDTSLVGYVGLTEQQNEYVYYKCYPVVSGYVTIELIDNPFTDRPDNKGFNGWVTDYEGALISYDDDYYVRNVKVPVTMTDSKPDDIEITMHADWIDANVGVISSTSNQWSSAFGNLKYKGLQQIGGTVAVYEDVTSYYISGTISSGQSYPSGAVNNRGQNQNGTCRTGGGPDGNNGTCTYYILATGDYQEGVTYYRLSGRNMTVYEPQIEGYEEVPGLSEGVLLAGYYREVEVAIYSSYAGYYDVNGVYQESGTCNTNGGCTYYELIQYYDDEGNIEVAVEDNVYYYMSTRDTNIVVVQTDISSSWDNTLTKPLTVTSVHNGVDYRDDVVWSLTNTYVKCYSDTVIENIVINSNQTSSNNSPSTSTSASRYFYGNYNNVKIGRGIVQSGTYKTFNGVYGGDNSSSNLGSSTNVTKYRLIVESGWYNTVTLTNGPVYTSVNKYVEAIAIYGNDYDKVQSNNSNLDVYYDACGSWGGGNYYSSSTQTGVTFDTIVKSGNFGSGKYDHTTGIYVGGRSYGTHYTARRVKVEGGWIYNLIGGPLTASNRGALNDTYMHIMGGQVDVVVGGAGTSATYGNRIISITGGQVNYSVFGGSNGYDGSGDDGKLNGSSFIYVGGTAIIGNSSYVESDSTLWGAEAGSVFGIGNGKEGTSSIGSNENSNVIIDGKAIINRNVYGGGNYGATGISSSSNTNTTNIWIKGGIVKGSIYGGGNNNGAGSDTKTSTINIEMTGGDINGSVYGGANKLGIVYGSVNLNVLAGNVVGSVYGGGEGGYQTATAYGTFVTDAINVTIGVNNDDNEDDNVPVIQTSVYGGSAYGTVNGDENSTTISEYNTKVVVNSGTISNVFGGGKGSDTYTPYVLGNVTVDVYGGIIDNVYGGNDLAGTPNGTVAVVIDGGIVANAYAGGNQTKVSAPTIKLLGGEVTNAYGGGNNAAVDVSDVLLDGSVCQNVFGGSNTSGEVDKSNVLCESGSASSIYGGNNLGGTTGITNVTINGGDIGTVYGGGNETSVLQSTNVNLNNRVGILFGGSNVSGDVPVSYIQINNGIATDVYGGNNSGGITTTSNISVNGGFINNIYGGGLNATTGISNIDFVYGYAKNIYGGGSRAGVTDTYINLNKGIISNVFGGSNNSGDIENTYIKNKNSILEVSNLTANASFTTSTINNSGATDIVSSETINVNIVNNTGVDIVEWDYILLGTEILFDSNWSGTSVEEIPGGIRANEVGQWYGTNTISSGSTYSFSFNVHSYVSYEEFNLLGYIIVGYDYNGNEYKTVVLDDLLINNVYGGNNLGGVTTISNIELSDGIIDYVYGGGEKATTNLTNVTLTDEVVVSSNVYGGGNQAKVVTDTNVNINGIEIGGSVYGGGNAGDVEGIVVLDISGSSVSKNVYGGGNEGKVLQDVTLTIVSDEIVGNIYGGGNQESVGGNVTVSISENTRAKNIYGGGNAGDVEGIVTLDISNSSSSENIFGGGDAGKVLQDVTLTIVSDEIVGNIYGGGNQESVGGNVTVSISENTRAKNIYGGGNAGDVEGIVTLDISNSSSSENIFGGGDAGKVLQDVTLTIASDEIVGNIYGGGNQESVGGNVTVSISENTRAKNIYGGGNAGDVEGIVTLDISNSSSSENIFGGGDAGKVLQDVTLTIVSDEIVGNIYGGGNRANVEGKVKVEISDTSSLNVYGGGNAGKVLQDVDLSIDSSLVKENIYGGGNQESVEGNVKVIVSENTSANNVYGGGNAGDVGGNIALDISNSPISENVYGGGNEGKVLQWVTLTVSTNEITGNIYGGGNKEVVVGNVIVKIVDVNVNNVYGGGNAGDVSGKVDLEIVDSSVSENIFGGGDAGKILKNVTLVVDNVKVSSNIYGGGNAASVGGNTDVIITKSYVSKSIFGGGNAGSVSGNTKLVVSKTPILESVYGGGNAAEVLGSTILDVDDCTVTNDVFGGGNFGAVGGSTSVYVTNCTVNDSIYGGGNGVSASVLGNTLLNVDGVTNVVDHIFGGGNAASVGCEGAVTLENGVVLTCSNPNNSISEINISGAIVGGNIYGGANTSKLFGVVYLNLGIDVIDDSYNLIVGDIDIVGTVFGGGEANASGSEDYDFSFISVTKGININIDAKGYSVFNISGSIFGSGNASSSGGYSYIDISNYGTFDDYKNNISIQRADIVTLNNSTIELSGAMDRTNEFDKELFTISRVDELKLKNGSTIFLDRGSNLLKKFSSLVDVDGEEIKASVDIDKDNGKITRNVNNRVYMYEGKNLNVSDSETLASYGEVDGMTFFGMFTKDRNNIITTALYSNDYEYGDEVSSSELYYFSSGSYVVGLHESAHNYYVDGFYSNYVSDDGASIYVDYIVPTPPSASYYRWVVGEDVNSIEVKLTASKYSTLGTYELSLLDYYTPNTEISILGVNFDELSNDISLLSEDEIPRIAKNVEDANKNFGLGMKSGNSGWITVGDTEFLTDGSGVVGTDTYYKDNSSDIPSFVFYLYHSKNLTDTKDLGSVTISLMVVTPIDELSNKIERINIVVKLSTALFDGDNYEATINVGSHYELFANSAVNITNDGTFSAYYSLFSTTENIYKDGYYRSLVSSYVFPVDTKITMIDFASGDSPEYYYYTVSESDYNSFLSEFNSEGEVSYVLSNFVRMGSSSVDNNYNDSKSNAIYYDSDTGNTVEEFIFIVDFGESDINIDVLSKSFLLEVRNANDSAVIPVLGISQEKMVYNLYEGKDAVVTVEGSLSSDYIYIGDSVNLTAVTNFVQDKTDNSSTIYDTKYFDEKLGIRLSVYDSGNNIVNGAGLLGVSFTYDGKTYYPREDGTVRFNIAEKVTNVAAKIKINTKGSKLSSGDYKILIESFGSYDGIYYGLVPSSSTYVDLEIINHIFGLNVLLDEKSVIVDSETGNTLNGNNLLKFNLTYDSGLENPNIRIALYRRNYDVVYNLIYDLVDLDDYLSANGFASSSSEYEYVAINSPKETNDVSIRLGENLITGTYKVAFKLYDGDSYIGEVYQYVIIE